MKRGDLVPRLFQDAFDSDSDRTNDDQVEVLLARLRETINIIWPFVGVPQVVPACLGLAGWFFRNDVGGHSTTTTTTTTTEPTTAAAGAGGRAR